MEYAFPFGPFFTLDNSVMQILTRMLQLCLSAYQLSRLQCILNASERAVTRTPELSRVSSVSISPHWLKINEAFNSKYTLSLSPHKVLQTNKPT
jgi:hypothetical protein